MSGCCADAGKTCEVQTASLAQCVDPPPAVVVSHVKITPLTHRSWKSMRVGFKLENGDESSIPQSAYSMFQSDGTSNGCYNGNSLGDQYCRPLLDFADEWSVVSWNTVGSFMQIKIPAGITVSQLGTQGSGSSSEWVLTYRVHISTDGARHVDSSHRRSR